MFKVSPVEMFDNNCILFITDAFEGNSSLPILV